MAVACRRGPVRRRRSGDIGETKFADRTRKFQKTHEHVTCNVFRETFARARARATYARSRTCTHGGECPSPYDRGDVAPVSCTPRTTSCACVRVRNGIGERRRPAKNLRSFLLGGGDGLLRRDRAAARHTVRCAIAPARKRVPRFLSLSPPAPAFVSLALSVRALACHSLRRTDRSRVRRSLSLSLVRSLAISQHRARARRRCGVGCGVERTRARTHTRARVRCVCAARVFFRR